MVLGPSFSRDTQHVNHLLTGVSPKPPSPRCLTSSPFLHLYVGLAIPPDLEKKKGSLEEGGLTKCHLSSMGSPNAK